MLHGNQRVGGSRGFDRWVSHYLISIFWLLISNMQCLPLLLEAEADVLGVLLGVALADPGRDPDLIMSKHCL